MNKHYIICKTMDLNNYDINYHINDLNELYNKICDYIKSLK